MSSTQSNTTIAHQAGQEQNFGVDSVETTQSAPVTKETIHNHLKTETSEAVDREKHIHHHQQRVQPVAAEETLATQHETNVVPEVTKETRNEMPSELEAKMQAQHSQHTDSQRVDTERTGANLGASVNEHTHHHVHEHIQPVIQKETHANKVVHNVIPVHEKIEETPVVHESTTLPTVSLDEFNNNSSNDNVSR